MFQYLNKNIISFFFLECSNFHERCGISWIERKIKFQIFQNFIFRDIVIFVLKSHQFLMKFHDISKNKIWKIYFSFVLAHYTSSIKTGSKLSGGGSAYLQLEKFQNKIKKTIANNYDEKTSQRKTIKKTSHIKSRIKNT